MTGWRDIIKVTRALVVVYLAGGLLLALVYARTASMIAYNQAAAKKAALQRVCPGMDSICKLGDWHSHNRRAEYYSAFKNGHVAGYIIESYGKGYSGYINVLAGVDTNLRIANIEIISHAETPGLGDGIETEWFRNQFRGKDRGFMKIVRKPVPDSIQAITGATISSRGVADDALGSALKFLSETLKKEKTNG